ncbi:acyltransferase [Erysipelotrichaceae bacterium HCN-30851]
MILINNDKRVVLYDNIRIIATILVVIGHATTLSVVNGIDIYQPFISNNVSNILLLIKNLIYSFHMPLFVFLSGCTFSLSYNGENAFDWIKRKGKLYIRDYLLISLLVYIPLRLLFGYYGNNINLLNILFNDVFLGKDINYLWYLIMLFNVSIIMRILIKSRLNRKKYIVLFLTLLLSILQFSLPVLPFQLHRTMEFLFWFYLGSIFEENRKFIIKSINRFNNNILFLISILSFMVLFIAFRYLDTTHFVVNIVIFVKLFKMVVRYMLELSGIILIIIICDKIGNIKCFLCNKIKENSYFIYLVHVPSIILFSKLIEIILPKEYINNYIYFFLIILKMLFGLLVPIIIKMIFKMMRGYQNANK